MDEPIEVNLSPPSGPHTLLEVASRNETHTPAASRWQMSYEGQGLGSREARTGSQLPEPWILPQRPN